MYWGLIVKVENWIEEKVFLVYNNLKRKDFPYHKIYKENCILRKERWYNG